jgi:hypothetical protein
MAGQDEYNLAEAIVAAILTTAVIDSTGTSPQHAVNQYARTLQRLREAGGVLHPSVPDKS